KLLIRGAAFARYVPPGYLLFVRSSVLFAVAFNADRLEVSGTPVAILRTIGGDTTTGASNFAVANGTIVYVPGSGETAQHRLLWLDRGGRSAAVALPQGMYSDVAVSPDGRRAAMTVVGGGDSDIWVHDFVRKTFTRMTFGGGSHRTPVWSRDGSMVYY